MSKYRDELSIQTTRERARLTEIPCAITLAEEIEDLKDVVNGLRKENRNRVDLLMKSRQRLEGHASW
jgi:hypothetical protein